MRCGQKSKTMQHDMQIFHFIIRGMPYLQEGESDLILLQNKNPQTVTLNLYFKNANKQKTSTN